MNNLRFIGAICASFGLLFLCIAPTDAAGTWETTLQPRDLDGDPSTIEAYYDTDLLITWLADPDYAHTSGYTTGNMTWLQWTNWAASLDLDDIAGPDGWRLPATVDVGNDGATYTNLYQGVDYGYNITTPSEMSHMFYTTLGNNAFYDTSGNVNACTPNCLTNTGPFSNLQAGIYISGTPNVASTLGDVWMFDFHNGNQGTYYNGPTYSAWAVHPGDFGSAIVPIPATFWLFGSGLLGIFGIARKTKAV